MTRKLLFAAGCGVIVGYVAGCTVRFDEDPAHYTCDTNQDCGAGYSCVDSKYCCKPDGNESDHGCDGKDNNCDGKIDEGVGTTEICNAKDDDCDGKIDNGFDLIRDVKNCGGCGKECAPGQICLNAVCVTNGEANCQNAMDDDKDGFTDCQDPDCDLQLCGTGCRCRRAVKAEASCDDTMDNDGDGAIDCADVDCENVSCGVGCVCTGGKKTETICNDDVDNDVENGKDCADTDCANKACQAAPSTYSCGTNKMCTCNGGNPLMETAALCRDGIDNNCDGKKDCAESACDGLSCNPDGGLGCLCVNLVAKETNCADRQDNDNDGTTDCMDALPDGGGDCPMGTPCTYVQGMVRNGTCAADRLCK